MKRADAGGAEDLPRRLRELPAVDRVAHVLDPAAPQDIRVAAARRAIDEARDAIRAGEVVPSFEDVITRAQGVLAAGDRSLLQHVINATGVLIHTNLGRVPLGSEQLDAVVRISAGYSNLEYELNLGRRGSRHLHTRGLIASLTGAESGLVVNNNAAAVLVVLAGLCSGREVIVSRGELIEIGGEFRVPEVMAASGTHLVEVGTTNRTHLADYERAISPRTAAIMKVHPSNYQLVGFTAVVKTRELALLARGRGVALLHDLGSGLVEAPLQVSWAAGEPEVRSAIADGADIVTFSGDKLLGGPQAGVIAGREDLIGQIAKHPLMRAVRVDKMSLAALEATLGMYARGEARRLPLWKMATAPLEDLEARAGTLAARLRRGGNPTAEASTCVSVTGGGSLPGAEIASWGVTLTHPDRSTSELERALRHLKPPVICRIEEERLVLDLRTVAPDEDDLLGSLLTQILT
ncbi:MAG: L-seryl-tRNA(Sec) selenium transferase [Actinomycetota bacterium]|nr:L-seryl-tRNA(Sec) selenium transferase [Actinomycetota bacterium]